MAEGGDDDDKTEEPTQKRLDDARQRGEIVYSAEVGAAFSLAAATMVVVFVATPMANELGRTAETLIENAGTLAADSGSLMRLYGALGLRILGSVGAAALIFILAAVATRYVQDMPVFSADKIAPKIERLNPIDGAKRVFGAQAFSSFVKACAKIAIVGAAALWVLWPRDGALESMPTLDPAAIMAYIRERSLALLFACTGAAATLAAADYFFTRQSYMKRMRMSRHDLKEEFRQSEGDPMVKAKLRQLRQERARSRMMAAVPGASAVITNPTHYAVAIKYDKEVHAAPICVAKGVNDVALRIREVAEEHEVPIIENPPLARALYASAELEEPIPREHYEAVAKVIGYVMRLAQRRRRR